MRARVIRGVSYVNNRFPLLFRATLFVLLPLLCVASYFYSQLSQSVPDYGTVYSIENEEVKANIAFSSDGVPHVQGQNIKDLFFAIGYTHAMERLWQLEVSRRIADGTLSQVMGEAALPLDSVMRAYGLLQAAENTKSALDKETIASLVAYAEGINYWLKNNNKLLPPEFLVAGVEPELWKPVDSIAIIKLFALSLSGNMDDELNRLAKKKLFPNVPMEVFYPYDLVETPEEVTQLSLNNSYSHTPKLATQFELLQQKGNIGGRYVGSNAWVVSGKHTDSGKPILANDPHLGISLPSYWYAAEMSSASEHLKGMTLVGLPYVVLGKNQHIAWGATNMMADQQDLFIETVSAENPRQYLLDDEWLDFSFRKELFDVKSIYPQWMSKKARPTTAVYRRTQAGAVLLEQTSQADFLLSLRWVALENNDTSLDAFYKLQFSRNWQEFRSALAMLKAPSLNFVYADNEGNIGFQASGAIPIRGNGDGTSPQLGSRSENHWQGYLEFDLLPSQYNPEQGFIVSANDKPESEIADKMSHEWASDYRKNRISEILTQHVENNRKMSFRDMQQMQRDVIDKSVFPLLDLMRKVEVKEPAQQKAIDILKQWQGEFSKDSVGATIYKAWFEQLKSNVLTANLLQTSDQVREQGALTRLISVVTAEQLVKFMTQYSDCNNSTVPCLLHFQNSLSQSLRMLRKLSSSDDMNEWEWGSLHRSRYDHITFSDVKLLEELMSRERWAEGSENSINVSNSRLDRTEGFFKDYGAGFRQIMSPGSNQKHDFGIVSGQSGNVFSPLYDNYLATEANRARK
nr:penicillin acylase family protein [Pseudoalteromonas sp. 2CM41L]